MPLRFTLRQLEYFVAAGETGSIARASERLNVSSPSISASIAQLEAEFGISLFVRKRAHGLTLTSAGEKLLVQSKNVLSTSHDLNSLAGTVSGSVQGPLNIGCLLTFAQIVLPSLRREFEKLYPEVLVRQFELDQTAVFSKLRQAEIDVALTYDLDIPSDIKFVKLLTLPPYLIVSPEHPLAKNDAVSIEDLAKHQMILLDLPHSSDYFLSFFKAIGEKPQIAERTRDMAVMRSLVANGFGYSIANIRPLNDLSPDGNQLTFIPLNGDVRPMHMGLAMVKGATTQIAISAFKEHCEAMIAEKRIPGLNVGPESDKETPNWQI